MILDLFRLYKEHPAQFAIVILGNGQYGNLAKKYFKKYQADIYYNKERIDINDTTLYNEINELSKTYSKVFVINSIAMTNTRTCEKNIIDSYNINALFPLNLAESIKNNENIILVQLSSGCIWDSNKENFTGFKEEDAPNPLILYASQKLQGEMLKSIKKEYIIIRPRMLFSEERIVSNLLFKIDGFSELIEEENSMTSIDTINKFIGYCIELINKNDFEYGDYNLCNQGTINPYIVKSIIEKQRERIHGNLYVHKKYSSTDKDSLMNKIREKYGLSDSFTLTNTIIDSSKAEKIFNKFSDSIPNIHDEITKKAFEYVGNF